MGNKCSCFSNAIRFPQVDDASYLDEAIFFIETRLDAILIDKPEEGTSGAETITTNSAGVASSIKYGSYFLEKVGRRVERHSCKIVKLNHDIQKVVIDILKGAEQIHCVGAGLGVVAYVFDQMDQISTNRNECVELLRFLCGLAKHIKERINHLPKEKLNDVVVFIVKGSFFCVSRMQSTNLSSSFSALVDEEEIQILQSQLTNKYPELGQYPDEDDKQNPFDLPAEDVLRALDELISYIEKCLAKPTATDKPEENTSEVDGTASSRVASSIEYGRNLLKKVLKRCEEHAYKIMSHETRKVVIDVLKEASEINWVAAGLSVVAYILQKVDDASTNKEECVKQLHYMYGLAKQIKQLNGHIPQEKLHDVAEFIFKGSFFCVSRIQTSNLSRFFSSVVDVEEIKSLQSELGHKYQDLTLEAVIQLLDAVTQLSSKIPVVLPPSQGKQPDAVGINEARDEVINLLDLRDQSARSVVLYGVGGIGKTTLATAVFSSLKLNAYKHCRVDIQQDCKESDLKDLQEQVLDDLFGQKIKLRNCEEGKAKLSNLFTESATQPIFLFIDNALRGSDLAKLLPKDLSCLPNRSRILMTTRKLDETDMIEDGGVKRYSYSVNILSENDSKKFLCWKALGRADIFFDKSLDIDGLLKICGGIPLVLEMVGSKLRKLGNDVRACESTIEFLKDTLVKGEGELSEKVVDVVYNTLEYYVYKDAFLDIAAFFNNWDQRIVGYVIGEVAFKAIQEAALVKISEEGKVIVHDIVQARGRKLSEGDRITDHESFQRAVQDTQRLEKLKGIWLPPLLYPHEFQLQAKHLELMTRSLRVLHLGERNKIDRESKETFPNLRFLHISGNLGMELTKLEKLAFLQVDLDFSSNGIPDSLRLLKFPNSLRLLKISGYSLPSLPENFGNLARLEELYLCQNFSNNTRFPSLDSLPDSFGQLKSLRFLQLVGCQELKRLPENFGNLCSLEEVTLSGIKGYKCALRSLPDSFGLLKSLRSLELNFLGTVLPENFGYLSSLKVLNLKGSRLTCLPDSFGLLSSLEDLDISSCSLTNLPFSFGQLSGLKKLNMKDCRELTQLPDGFGQLKSLKYLNMRDCFHLEMVSDDFGQLSSVCVVNAARCSRLDGKAMDKLVEMKSLLVLDIEESPMLIKRWREVKVRHPLIVLDEERPFFYGSYGQRPDALPRYHEHPVSSALFHKESRFLHNDGDLQIAEWSPGQGQVAFVLTLCDLSSPSNKATLEMVKEKIAELASQGFDIVYVCMGQIWKQNVERIRQSLPQLPCGTRAWIAADEKSNKLLGYSIYQLVSPRIYFKSGRNILSSYHTLIASACLSLDEKGEKHVHDIKLKFPVSGDVEAFTDTGGGFSGFFFPLRQMELFLDKYYVDE